MLSELTWRLVLSAFGFSRLGRPPRVALRPKASDLVHYDYAELYDVAFAHRKDDVRFFVEHARSLGARSILELGAGSGRVTQALARAGFEVTAVDASPSMLARLNARLESMAPKARAQVRAVRGDMRSLRLRQRFDLVLGTFNVVAHLKSFRDMARFLRTARAHLLPEGSLLFDLLIPHPDEVEADPDERFPAPRFKDPVSGRWVRQTERFDYDPRSQELLVESELSLSGMPDPLILPLVLRQWFPKEVEAALEYEGWKGITTYADYSEQPGLMAEDTLVFRANP